VDRPAKPEARLLDRGVGAVIVGSENVFQPLLADHAFSIGAIGTVAGGLEPEAVRGFVTVRLGRLGLRIFRG
jgi:hypothetical protein